MDLFSASGGAQGSDFWPAVGVASAIATALATGVSTLAALWWRWHDRKEADWLFADARATWHEADRHGNPERSETTAALANVGDGTAYRVEVSGRGCEVTVRRAWESGERRVSKMGSPIHRPALSVLPVAAPGATVDVSIECPLERWDAAEVLITWTRPPTWKKRRGRRRSVVPLAEIVDRPPREREVVDPLSGQVRTEPVRDADEQS